MIKLAITISDATGTMHAGLPVSTKVVTVEFDHPYLERLLKEEDYTTKTISVVKETVTQAGSQDE